MKDLFRKIKKNEKRIFDIDSRIEDIKTTPFYDQYGSEQEKERDLMSCYEAMKVNLDLRQALLENLQIEINKELHLISQNQKTITLLKSA